ncbi:MAG: SsrA-binding protein SmpB [Rhodothermales bacterium]
MSEDIKLVASNRKARHEFHIEDTLEAGMVLHGTEVKSLREGKVQMQDAFCTVQNHEMMLLNCHISPFKHGGHFNHEATAPRKLLLHRKEIEKWREAIEQKGFTIVPLRIYFKSGRAKIEIGLAKGKKLYDKRADIADRDSKRRLDRVMRSGKDE